jgi:hypothetical protein
MRPLLLMININLRKPSFFFIFLSLASIAFGQKTPPNQWAWDQVEVYSDFNKLSGRRNITIAIIDDAFLIENAVLKGYFKTNPKDLPDNHIDDDHNGKVDDYLGWDFSDNDPNVNPPQGDLRRFGHGTKVAGIVIEGLNRLLLNPKDVIKILPLKSSSDTRNNNYITDGYEAIKYAIEQKADIIVCCWSGGIFDKEKEEVLRAAQKAGIIMVASAGNFVSEKEQFPGAYSWVINTAALNSNFQKQQVSNYGRFVDISVPGDSLITLSTIPNAPNSSLSGTSASAAFLGGIVAAIFSAFPKITPQECDRILKNASDPLETYNPLFKGKLGSGVLNVKKLIHNLEAQESSPEFHTPKGYIGLSKNKRKVIAHAKYPEYKLINSQPQTQQNINVLIEKWDNLLKSDTIVNLAQLNLPFEFKADSFVVSTNKNLKSNIYLYFEAMAIDSSYLYCTETLHLTDKRGIITDGSGEENYANNSNCKWELEVSKEKRIKITFEEMDTEAKIDQIYIFSDYGTESPILAIFSGQNLPPQITTWTHKALIWFVSNGAINYKGWKLRYEEVD